MPKRILSQCGVNQDVYGPFSKYLSKNGKDMSSTFFQNVCIISLFLSFDQFVFRTQNFFSQAFILENQVFIRYNMFDFSSP